MPTTVLEVFQEEVPAAFAYLESRYGFALRRDDDYAFTASSRACEIAIELDWGSVVVSVRRLDGGRSVRLSFIVGAVDPEVLFLPRYPWGPEEAREEVERQARLLLAYCAPLLEGDFTRWSALEAHQQAVLDEWRRESERLVREARVKLVRRRAAEAFATRDFATAAQLYGSIKEHLSPEETQRLEYAHRRTILVPVPRQRLLEGLA